MSLATPRQLLVATDFSECADAALDAAIDLAQARGIALDLLHVYAIPGGAIPSFDLMWVGTPEMLTALQARITEALEKRAAQVRAKGLVCTFHSVPGIAAVEIVSAATTNGADAIVVGTHGRSGLSHALVGSVAERVVQHATCPVIVVPHRDARRSHS